MTIKEQVREFLKSLLKLFKSNPELFTGFFLGFVLIIILAGFLFSRVITGPGLFFDNDTSGNVEIELNEPIVYEVQAGDSSWKVAKNFYGCGEAYRLIEEVNVLEPDSLLEIGQKLVILDDINNICEQVQPHLSGLTSLATSPGVLSSSGEDKSESYHVVQGDCLWSIALEQTGNPYNWVEIYELNREIIGSNPDLIYPQTNLSISNSLY